MRRKVLNFFLAVTLVLTLIPTPPVHSEADFTVSINPDVQFQTFEGWGTSLAWFGKTVGGWSEGKRDEIADLLFDEKKGLGMNIVRYNIGGGENPEHNHMDPYRDMPGFQPKPGVWDWNADANQRQMLLEALERGVNITEAFSNSPPYWMTKSQCAGGAEDKGNNLKDEYYDAFADYLTEVVKHYRDTWGITFQTLDPLNEPSADWWYAGRDQEGCHFDADKQNEIIKKVGEKLAQKGLTGTTIAASDETSPDHAISSLKSFDSAAKSYISRINVHQYLAGDNLTLREMAISSGKKLWMSEYCTDGGVPSNPEAIEPGLIISSMITSDLKDLGAEAWLTWQAVAGGNWGLIDGSSYGAENYKLTKTYYIFGNYSKFIRPGYKIIGNDDQGTITAYDEKSKTLVIVTNNPFEGKLTYEYNLSKFGAVGDTVSVYRTSPKENLVKLPDIKIRKKTFAASAPGESVTTYVISGVKYADEETFRQSINRLQNSATFYTKSSKAIVNNNWFNLDNLSLDLMPVIRNERVLVPLRFVAEKLGGTMSWNKNKTAVVEIGSNTISFTVGSKIMKVNRKSVKLDTSAQILTNSRLYVPLRALAEQGLGKKVFHYKGLVIISDKKNLIDLKSEKVIADRILSFFK